MKTVCIAVFTVAALALAAIPASAQPVAPSKSGLVDYIEGTVYVNDELVPDPIVASFPYVKENGTVRTEAGRAEAFMQGGVSVRLGENSTLRMITSRFIDTRVQLEKGSAVVQIMELLPDNNLTFVLKDATITLAKAGNYRLDAEPARIKVFSGLANVTVGDRRIDVGAGKMLDLSGTALAAEKFNKEWTDQLDRWSMQRGAIQANANLSASRDVYMNGSGRDPCRGYGSGGYVSPTSNPCGTWRWNPYFGLYTYIPVGPMVCDFWGYCMYNPGRIMSVYYPPRPMPSSGGFGGGMGNYGSMPSTSSGSSGAVAASSGAASAPSAGSGASAGAAASSSSAGHGSSAGGHGR